MPKLKQPVSKLVLLRVMIQAHVLFEMQKTDIVPEVGPLYHGWDGFFMHSFYDNCRDSLLYKGSEDDNGLGVEVTG